MRGKAGGAPHLQKQAVISEFREKFGLKILVETGTYLGEMVNAKKHEFAKIYSIELAEIFYLRAKKRFAQYPQITILEGDSASVLAGLCGSLDQPVLFWLDGHYSGGLTARSEQDTPVAREISNILANIKQRFVILIDDARLFVGTNGYPTLEELEKQVKNQLPNSLMEVRMILLEFSPNNMLKKVLKFLASPFMGKTWGQKFFSGLYLVSLRGMNFGGGVNPAVSGELYTVKCPWQKYRHKHL